MTATSSQAPAGEIITIQNGSLQVPDFPIIPFVEGDGTGPDIWRASVRVFDAAVEKAYGGKRKLMWHEVLAGEKAFKQTGDMMTPLGVFANQPNPYSTTGSVVLRRLGLFLVVLFAMLIGNVFVSRGDVAYTSRHTFVHGTDDSAAFVTPAFELKGRPSSVSIDIASDVDNDWAYFALTLINDSTGISREVGKQVSYYYGRDSDGSWSEGSRKGSVRLSSVPGGRYFLRVGPEGGEPSKPPVHYTITVKRDTPSFGFYALAFFALTLPAILAWIPKGAFEGRRWAESDYAPSSGSDDDEGDDEAEDLRALLVGLGQQHDDQRAFNALPMLRTHLLAWIEKPA
mgnify:CR=1 FL=1